MTLAALGAQVQATATLPGPYRLAGGRVDLTATAPDLAALAPLARLPPLRDVRAQAQLALDGGDRPTLTALRVQAGASDLSAILPGLRLASLDAAARSATGPVELVAHGSLGRTPLAVQGSAGPLPALLPGGLAPASVDLAGSFGPATVALKGSIASPRTLSGKDLALAVQLSDLAAFAAARRPAFAGAEEGVAADLDRGRARRRSAARSGADGAAGRSRRQCHARPRGRAAGAARDADLSRLDLDALRRLFATPPPAAPAATAPAPTPAARARPRAKTAATPAAKAAAIRPLLSERPLDLAPLRAADADLHLTIAVLHVGGADWRDVSGHLLDVAGNLALAPFAALLPGGAVDGTFSLDATKPAPPVALTLHAPALAIGPTWTPSGWRPR